jgi:predicted phosphodiesterase
MGYCLSASKTFLAFSCTHCPHQDDVAIAWLLGQIADRKPDVIIHLGDMCEGEAGSKWNDEAMHTLLDEYEVANEMLKSIRRVAPKSSSLVMLQGNHDANILAKGRIDPRVRQLLDMRKNIDELQHWNTKAEYEYDRRRGCFRLGQVCFSHGYDCSEAGIRREAIYFLQGHQFGMYVHGHTHRSHPPKQLMATSTTPLPWWVANAGCMRDLKPDFVKRLNTQLWSQAIVVGESEMIKSPRSYKCWDAETVVFRGYDQWRAETV